MQCLVIWAHPDPSSYNAALCEAAVAALRSRGHQVTLLDLYREGFDPVLSPTEKAS
ncbi:NAD(P)H-dependent oxidoreductase [Aquabacterium parvum]|uniref:NAD(P)H-dependent oxidoreductase n=1 Tax=Aquabacterium parvum TaxID=70584 RepID=UPI0009F883AB|nr:NAD(P)H-dependent oxidoreductase [Aquabacterium parvum]MBU0918284.1 NAD(P)H-dependent oxidoreductase [Gammaproteobacteria bacterium]